MNKHFLGSDIKTLCKHKGSYSIIVRFRGEYQTLELCGKTMNVSIEAFPGISLSRSHYSVPLDALDDWVYLYANQHDTSWQFFVNSLKPNDEVIFFERENGTPQTKDDGYKVYELRVRITRRKKNGDLSAIFETTLKTSIRK